MTKQVDVGLFFGESFYEVIFTERPSNVVLFSNAFFNLKDPFKTKFPKLFQAISAESQSEIKINSVYVGYRYLERIFKFKLGGSVAQVVTKGFEHWLSAHQFNKVETLFSLKSAPDLSSTEMIFSVDEKINPLGGVEKELTTESISSLIAELKKKEAKRICLNLVNSHKNPSHNQMIKAALIENQFEVFDALDFGATSDSLSWRTSLIESSLAGTFNELKSEITEALQVFVPAENVHFLISNSSTKNSRNILSGLFALEESFFHFAKTKYKLPDHYDVIHLGLENFSVWINSDDTWQSPWGPTSLKVKKRIDLKVQPTNSFHLNSFEDVEISFNEESFEPGPMCLGRGKIPCVYDILNCGTVLPELQKKIRDSFWALARSSNGKHTADKAFDEFRTVIWNRILIESSLLTSSETTVFYGDFSPQFETKAKDFFKTKNLVFISQKEFPKSWLSLLKGRLEFT